MTQNVLASYYLCLIFICSNSLIVSVKITYHRHLFAINNTESLTSYLWS